ncbi:MAG: phosphatase PAP2 family protein [Ruminococcaceae bacterium]|jgi:undecaprenyl-diphosphatase|nr:phosphatase PAP2 family protein [Oscillospiraceae bacterium]
MSFLYFLEGLRNPVTDAFFSAVTYLGDEICFMALAVLVFWCVSKRRGYYLFSVGFFGIAVNQFLKLLFHIPRPWVQDPDFTIVESARAAAAGYSFPSGHTQNIAGTMGVVAVSTSRRWLRVLCVLAAVLVSFSRMYLGVHTPLDVGVALVTALALTAALYPLFRDEVSFRNSIPFVLGALVLVSALYTAFVLLFPFPADVDAENLASGVKNACTMCGCSLGLAVSYLYDQKVLHFDTRASFVGQVLKLVLGLAVIIGLRMVLKAPLLALFHGSQAANAVRYFIMVLFAGCVWPHTFPLFARIGRKKR